jgi:hypothetical protein
MGRQNTNGFETINVDLYVANGPGKWMEETPWPTKGDVYSITKLCQQNIKDLKSVALDNAWVNESRPTDNDMSVI